MHIEPEISSSEQKHGGAAALENKDLTAPNAKPGPTGPSMYNFVKAIAKESSGPEAAAKIADRLKARPDDVDSQNSKKSTGLHACGYLRRWDIAQEFLNAGADPEIKNDAGHSFFLTAAKTPGAQLDVLFASRPDLLEKHGAFESKNAKKTKHGSSAKIDKSATIAQNQESAARTNTRPESPWRQYLAKQEWSKKPPAAKEFMAAGVSAEEAALFVEAIPESVLANLLSDGIALPPAIQGQALLRLCQSDAGRSCAEGWAAGCLKAPIQDQREAMKLLAEAGADHCIHHLAQAGISIEDELVEICEEREWHALADLLIDLRSMRSLMSPAAHGGKGGGSAGKKRVFAPSQAQDRKPASAKRKTQGGARGPNFQNGRGRKLGLIANLDGPVREASDFDYAERKPLAKAPLIIVKKSRRPATGKTLG